MLGDRPFVPMGLLIKITDSVQLLLSNFKINLFWGVIVKHMLLAVFYLFFLVYGSAQGMAHSLQKFEDSWENPWDPVHESKRLYEKAYEHRTIGDMTAYKQVLQKAAQPVIYRSYNGPESERRATGYFKAEYDWARLLEKDGNFSDALSYYNKSLCHSRYSTENKAKELYSLCVERIEEILNKNPNDSDALVLLAREGFRGNSKVTIEQAFEYLNRVETEIPQEERFALFEKYGWGSVVSSIDPLSNQVPVHKKGLAYFHRAQLKYYGVGCDQQDELAVCDYVEALKFAQTHDTYKEEAEHNLRSLALDSKRSLRSVGEYMNYLKLQKQWDKYCTIGHSILDDSEEIFDEIYEKSAWEPKKDHWLDSGSLILDYFENHYSGLFVVDIDDKELSELRFKLKALEVRYQDLKAREIRFNKNKNVDSLYTNVFAEFESAFDGYKELARLSQPTYLSQGFKVKYGNLFSFAGLYLLSKIGKVPTTELFKKRINDCFEESYHLGSGFGSVLFARFRLNEPKLTTRSVQSYLHILETHASKTGYIGDDSDALMILYDIYSGKKELASKIPVKNSKKADELIQRAVDLKLQQVCDALASEKIDGKLATESLRKLINEIDIKEIIVNLEKHPLLIKIREELIQQNKMFGSIISMAIQQRLKNLK